MKKIFKISLFKKFFLIILCGFIFVEGMHIYLDYHNNIHSIEANAFTSDIHFELEKIWKKLVENEEITDEQINKLINDYNGYFIFTDKDKNIIKQTYNTTYDNIEPDFFMFLYDTNNNIDIQTPVFIDMTKLDKEVIDEINKFIQKNPIAPLTVHCTGKTGTDLLSDTFIDIESLKINDKTFIGEGNDTETPYYIYRYYNEDIYYLYDTIDALYNNYTPYVNIEVKSEQLATFKKAFENYSTTLDNIIYHDMSTSRIENDFYSFYTICFDKKTDLPYHYMTYIEIKENAYNNLFIQTIQNRWEIYLTAFILSIITSLLISYLVTKRIRNINTTTKLITNNQFDIKLNEKGNDELSELSKNINIMSNQLKTTIQSLNNEINRVTHLEGLRKEFLTQFTHEVKTPLGIINGYIELYHSSQDETKKKEYLEAIEKETKNVNELVLTMLCLSKLESGKVELNKEEIDLDEIFLSILDNFYDSIKNKNINVKIDSNHSSILADKSQIEILIKNLIINAITQSSNITIKIDNTMFSIENEGKHFKNEHLKKIWDTYTFDNRNGTGLRLAICKTILDLHKFQYQVENTKNGIKFTIYHTQKKDS